MPTDLAELEDRLWAAADELRANSGLRASEYSSPVLGLIFLRFAESRFAAVEADLEGSGSNIVRLYRDEEPESERAEDGLFAEQFPDGAYADVPGLCKVATIEEIEAQEWSLNPGRYVGTEVEDLEDEEFEEQLAAAQAELRSLGARARELEEGVDEVLTKLLLP